jgi:hypothetical protein
MKQLEALFRKYPEDSFVNAVDDEGNNGILLAAAEDARLDTVKWLEQKGVSSWKQLELYRQREPTSNRSKSPSAASANTSAPLELSMVLAQSHPQQSVFCWPASPRHSLAWGHCLSAQPCSLAQAPEVLHSCAFAHVSPSL